MRKINGRLGLICPLRKCNLKNAKFLAGFTVDLKNPKFLAGLTGDL
jgi:hypothetical protein